ncbi:MAG TPA: YhjD/YihY/BrkB family envelope integrity protein [Acidimicrobiales bacterium]|nr:YhjD/YihY/BrkB family envelope integrity protein [Acidimicrobiales bacterium]
MAGGYSGRVSPPAERVGSPHGARHRPPRRRDRCSPGGRRQRGGGRTGPRRHHPDRHPGQGLEGRPGPHGGRPRRTKSRSSPPGWPSSGSWPSCPPSPSCRCYGPDETYGSLGGVVVAMLWLFLTAYVVIMGAELDAELERQTVRDTTEGRDEPLGQRDAEAADTVGATAGEVSARRRQAKATANR